MLGRGHEARRHGVALDVAAQRQQVGVAIDRDRLVAALEQVADQAVALVEALRVDAVEVPHQARQVALARVQHEVVVVAHQAVRQHLGVEAVERMLEHGQVLDAVGVIAVDRLAAVTARGDVVDGAGEFEAEGAGHGAGSPERKGKRQDLTPRPASSMA